MSIEEVPTLLRKNGLADVAVEWELMQEVLALYANAEDRSTQAMIESGEDYDDAFSSIPIDAGIKARQHRTAFKRREAERGYHDCVDCSDGTRGCTCGLDAPVSRT
jgi:hypothetical protein